jgi:branched-chain amino acid aminotransferase
MSIMWHSGDFKDITAPVLTAQDRLRLGHGVFDTMLVVAGRPQFAALHFARLIRHAAVMGIACPYTAPALMDIAGELIEKNNLLSGQGVINTLLTQGPAKRGLRGPADPKPQLMVKASAVPQMKQIVTLITATCTRRNEHSPLSAIKSCNYGDNILAMQQAEANGADDALLLNTSGRVACAAAANILVMLDEKVYTPPLSDGAMEGVIRAVLLERGVVTERSLTPQDLVHASAIWICNSLRGIVPVIRLDDRDLMPEIPPELREIHFETV